MITKKTSNWNEWKTKKNLC